MCNIAGYIGERRAAPILVEMIRREQGLYGGYYTGIATWHEGKIYSAKVVGSVDRLLAKTDALDLPGTCGIIHSRTPGGGDREWSHPFLSNDGAIACVLNGSNGAYFPYQKREETVARLLAEGVKFASATENFGKRPIQIDEKRCAHTSEVLTHLTRSYMKSDALPLDAAMARAFGDLPLAAVMLGLCVDAPQTISYTRMNAPMLVARQGREVYLATCAFAFPEGVDENVTLLPAASYGTVTQEGTVSRSFTPPLPVLEADGELLEKIEKSVLTVLENAAEPLTCQTIFHATKHLYVEGTVRQNAHWVYGVLWSLYRQGRLAITPFTVPYPTLDEDVETAVTQFGLSLIK